MTSSSRRATLTCALSFLAVIAAPTLAQDWRGRGRVHGEVKSADGAPVVGAKVHLAFGKEGGDGPTVNTDKKGNWSAAALRGGMWNVDVEAEGFVTRKLSVAIQEEGSGPTVAVTLQKAVTAPTIDPHIAELKATLAEGNTHFQAGRFAEARAAYEKVAAEHPEELDIQRSIAYCFYKEGNLGAAAEALGRLVEKDPTKTENALLLANILLEKGDLDPALAALARVDDAQVKDLAIYINLSILLLNKDRADEALKYLDKCIARDPQYADAYYYRGRARLQTKDFAAAKADLLKFVELKPDAPEVAAARAMLGELK